MDALNHLRQEIDAVDRELIQLFAKRLELVTQVGEVKHEKVCRFMHQIVN